MAAFLDFQGITSTVADLQAAFPETFVHAFAAKANLFQSLLTLLRSQGMGAEVASAGEFELAWRAGFEPSMMVYDAPVKTKAEIELALSRGIALNIDNFQELDWVASRLAHRSSNSIIGIRINPQVGAGEIEALSTASRSSKFGVALKDQGNRERLIQAYVDHAWLTGIHTHVGSQGCPLELMCAGIAETVALAEELNTALGHQQIRMIDMGGGLPVNFDSDEMTPSFAQYAALLRERVPALFSGRYKVMTEFGRSVVAKHGMTIGRVEFTKVSGGRHIALTHAGAHTLVRTVLDPEHWSRRISGLDSQGRPKQAEMVPQDIAGPCCFQGDVIAHLRPLPLLEPGDYVLVHDTGAYCFSTPFQYNGLPNPDIYAFTVSDRNEVTFDLIKAAQSDDEVVAAYS